MSGLGRLVWLWVYTLLLAELAGFWNAGELEYRLCLSVVELCSLVRLSLVAVPWFCLGGQGPGVNIWSHYFGNVASVALSVLFKNVNIYHPFP